PLRYRALLSDETASTDTYTLSLHDALPISEREQGGRPLPPRQVLPGPAPRSSIQRPGRRSAREKEPVRAQRFWNRSFTPDRHTIDRKSTRLNSSHSQISYAVFCLKKKKHNI